MMMKWRKAKKIKAQERLELDNIYQREVEKLREGHNMYPVEEVDVRDFGDAQLTELAEALGGRQVFYLTFRGRISRKMIETFKNVPVTVSLFLDRCIDDAKFPKSDFSNWVASFSQDKYIQVRTSDTSGFNIFSQLLNVTCEVMANACFVSKSHHLIKLCTLGNLFTLTLTNMQFNDNYQGTKFMRSLKYLSPTLKRLTISTETTRLHSSFLKTCTIGYGRGPHNDKFFLLRTKFTTEVVWDMWRLRLPETLESFKITVDLQGTPWQNAKTLATGLERSGSNIDNKFNLEPAFNLVQRLFFELYRIH